MLTSALENHPAPLPLGDETENSVLVAGQFFALPTNLLRLVVKAENDLQLKPLV
jgi:hypothetical protein